MMEQKVGISICLEGTAEWLVGSRICHIVRGTATVLSPVLPIVKLQVSDDFNECIIEENMNLVAEETTSFFSRMMPIINQSAPCVKLDESTLSCYLELAERINDRDVVKPESSILEQVNDKIKTLMRLEFILGVLYEIATGIRSITEKASRGEQVFVRFIQSLGKESNCRRNVAEYADEAALTIRHFSTLIHQYSGRTPKEWITNFTINKAKSLLHQSEVSVKEISFRLGFPEQFTFRKYFKKNVGISPTEYRKHLNIR